MKPVGKLSLTEFLEKISQKTDDGFGKQFRSFFADNKGSAELAMLASPTSGEVEQLKRAVAIMTESEKQNADTLNDEQVKKIADDAKIDAGVFAIFINGYALQR
ncbi:MAG TPA: hypothetical protein DDW84_05685 [Phycisphaerales bacterium]|nr:MAG: hypothetical protein A2Y13_09705 [Planctomycetes bacterium GWC2_45_44]HBG78325.1 hypothetical protein [Phycisphaerales bacterium]HBR20833.1 hypothetical protein [Phycisphaerales bacterium]